MEENLSRSHADQNDDALYLSMRRPKESERGCIIRLAHVILRMQANINEYEKRLSDHGWADYARQQERSGGTM